MICLAKPTDDRLYPIIVGLCETYNFKWITIKLSYRSLVKWQNVCWQWKMTAKDGYNTWFDDDFYQISN